jgi:hypothetical protein
MAGENAAIWQVQSGAANGSEATATSTNTVDFNSSTKVPSDGSFADNILVDFRRAVPENEAVDADNNEIQDMGIDGLDIVVTAFIGNANEDDAARDVNKLSRFLQQGNTTTGYTKGRYGLRLDNAPQWNVVPTSTYGYHLRSIRFEYIGENVDLVKVTIAMSLGGDIGSAI